MNRKELGDRGERKAEAFLLTLGYQILERNWNARGGELDLIALDGETIVMVEVKLRSRRAWAPPEDSVTRSKQRRLIETAWAYLEKSGGMDRDWRIDVVAIETTASGGIARLDHYRDAVREPAEGPLGGE
ncbi:MAG: YraN family protein [Anaerolineales bacterium]